MTKIYSPFRVDILLHYHAYCEPHPRYEDNEATQRQVAEFVEMGVLTPSNEQNSGFITTPLGKAWVDAICSTRLPRAAFIDEMGRVIK